MAERIIQICPASPEVRIAWYNKGEVDLYPPACLAIVEKGTAQDVVYLEIVDNEVKPVDTDDKDFLGFVASSQFDTIKKLKEAAEARYEKEENVGSK